MWRASSHSIHRQFALAQALQKLDMKFGYGVSFTVPVLVTPSDDAVTVAPVSAPTALVVAVKVAVVLPGPMNTDAGTTRCALFEAKFTERPRLPVFPVRVTVNVTLLPPTTAGSKGATLLSGDGRSVTSADR